MSDESPLGALLGIFALGGMFFLGNKAGEKRTRDYYENLNRDKEIDRLRQEIEQLRNEKNNIKSIS